MKTGPIGWMVLLTILGVVSLFFTTGTVAQAAISKTGSENHCTICHEPGAPHNHHNLRPEYQGPQGCVNCHSSSLSSTTYELLGAGGESVTVPVVNYTGLNLNDNDPILAGGNFFWVQTEDSKGHNIFATNPENDLVNGAPFDTGPAAGCGWDGSCHRNFHLTNDLGMPGLQGRQGCTKCHMLTDDMDDDDPKGFHHADDSNLVVGSETADDDGYFRFLKGHQAGAGHGVCGIEDNDWEASPSSSDHNEYLGFSGSKTSAGSLSVLGHTMTGFCCGCHGNKHISQDAGSKWIRHPSGAVLCPDGLGDCELAAKITYTPQAPVSRPDLSGYVEDPPTNDTGAVAPDTDMVMCLSCHRAHGSPYPKMLRWEPVSGCDDCHITATQCP